MKGAADIFPCSLAADRLLEDFPIANVPLREHQRRALGGARIGHHVHAWLAAEDLENLEGDLVDERGEVLAWGGTAPGAGAQRVAVASFMIRQPWDLLRANEQVICEMGEASCEGEIHPLAVVEGVVKIGEGTRILPGVFIEGNVVIGAHCKIGPNCYLRGNTSIGDKCHIGQSVEIKNSLILSHTNVGHLSYVGDSVLGSRVNFGAGTTTSNLRHDGRNHFSMVGGDLVDTGRRKFGAVVGDGVHTGIHTSLYPGRKLWPGTSTRPGEIVQRDIVPTL